MLRCFCSVYLQFERRKTMGDWWVGYLWS